MKRRGRLQGPDRVEITLCHILNSRQSTLGPSKSLGLQSVHCAAPIDLVREWCQADGSAAASVDDEQRPLRITVA